MLGREIGRGGEAAVWEICSNPGSVAKVYHERVDAEKVEKLVVMAGMASADILKVAAWPTGTLHRVPGGELVGCIQPRISGHTEIHQLYSPIQRKQRFPKADWKFLAHVAMNCAAAFETIHNSGHIIGDVNQSGVLVAGNGTVHLIDCDSFQIRANGRIFRCNVGVPQYTPPELQGRIFHEIDRKVEHDCFGLAVLIFHLLFMGRHPFAGRFQGQGDMPIEKAISEGRFAFSRSAPSYHMIPPPHSLPLTVLPGPISEMFERAFARPASGVTRPVAQEWREIIGTLTRDLRLCPLDKGHVYPARVTGCPWCAILRSGGPNFFISVQLATEGKLTDLPALNLAEVWQRIEAIQMPYRQRPDYLLLGPAPVPSAIPDSLLDLVLFLRITKIVALCAAGVAVIGAFTNLLIELVGVGIAVVFGVWWEIITLLPAVRKERVSRRSEAKAKRAALTEEQKHWDAVSENAARRFREIRARCEQARGEGQLIRAMFDEERRSLEQNVRQAQLQDFLENHPIESGKIPLIGPGRFATLLSYGIETAADIDEVRLEAIPGFGPAVNRELIAWRDEVSKYFVFDPQKALSPAQLSSVVSSSPSDCQLVSLLLPFAGNGVGEDREGDGTEAAEPRERLSFFGSRGPLLLLDGLQRADGREYVVCLVVNDEQVGLEIPGQRFVLGAQIFLTKEVASQIEDGAIQNHEAALDRLVSDSLSQKRFAYAGRAQQQHVGLVADELAAGQIVNLFAFDRGVEGEVELVQVFGLAEHGRLDAPADLPAGADIQFVLKDQFQKLDVFQAIAGRLAQSNVEARRQAGKPELAERLHQRRSHGMDSLRLCSGQACKGGCCVMALRTNCP
jgi:DNA-binding helix-hairpin-helix protein with protein kinase domain